MRANNWLSWSHNWRIWRPGALSTPHRIAPFPGATPRSPNSRAGAFSKAGGLTQGDRVMIWLPTARNGPLSSWDACLAALFQCP